jgi:hypothetical protein
MAALHRSTIVCDVEGLAPDLAALDALARVQLAARRAGLELQLRHASPELRGLLAFTALDEVLPVEPGGEAEEREQGLGVEEEGEFHDPPA